MSHASYSHYVFKICEKYIGIVGFKRRIVLTENRDKVSVWNFIPESENDSLFYVQDTESGNIIHAGALKTGNYLVALGKKDSKGLMRVDTEGAISDGASIRLYLEGRAVSCENDQLCLADVPVEIRLEKVMEPGRAAPPSDLRADEEDDDFLLDDPVETEKEDEGDRSGSHEEAQAELSSSGGLADPASEARDQREARPSDAVQGATPYPLEESLRELSEKEEALKERIRLQEELLARYQKKSEEYARLDKLSKQLEEEIGRLSSMGEAELEACREHLESLSSALPAPEKAMKLFLAENRLTERLMEELERGRDLKERLRSQCAAAEKEYEGLLQDIAALKTQLEQKKSDFLKVQDEEKRLKEKLQEWIEEDLQVAEALSAADLQDALVVIERKLLECDRILDERIRRSTEAGPEPMGF